MKGATKLALRTGVGYCAEALALFARMAPPPSAAQKAIINGRILALKAKALWNTFDVLYVLAAQTSQQSLLNWRQDLYNGTIVGGVTFTANVGQQGDGTTGYIDTGFNPTTAVSPKFTQDSGSIGFWSQTSGQATSVEMGNNNTVLQCRSASNVFNHRVNSSASGSVINITDGTGLFLSSRTGSPAASNLPYKDGTAAAVNTNPGVSAAPDNNNIRVLGRSGAGVSFSARVSSLAFIASGWTAQNVADFYAIFA